METEHITAWQFLMDLNKICFFTSRERTGKASNSELKRWIKNQAFVINGERVKWDEMMDFPISSVVLFPKKRITLY